MDEKKQLKILIVTQYFWPENFRVNDIVAYLKKQGAHVEILTGRPNYPGAAQQFNSLQCCRVHFALRPPPTDCTRAPCLHCANSLRPGGRVARRVLGESRPRANELDA